MGLMVSQVRGDEGRDKGRGVRLDPETAELGSATVPCFQGTWVWASRGGGGGGFHGQVVGGLQPRLGAMSAAALSLP